MTISPYSGVEVMEVALRESGLKIAGSSDFGGAGFWIEGPPGLDATALADELRGDGVLIEPGDVFYASSDPPRRFFRMAYSSIPQDRIPEGVRRVARRIGSASY